MSHTKDEQNKIILINIVPAATRAEHPTFAAAAIRRTTITIDDRKEQAFPIASLTPAILTKKV